MSEEESVTQKYGFRTIIQQSFTWTIPDFSFKDGSTQSKRFELKATGLIMIIDLNRSIEKRKPRDSTRRDDKRNEIRACEPLVYIDGPSTSDKISVKITAGSSGKNVAYIPYVEIQNKSYFKVNKRFFNNDTLSVFSGRSLNLLIEVSIKLDEHSLQNPRSQVAADLKRSAGNKNQFTDFVFKIETSSKEFKAHKCILAARSTLFRDMFLNDPDMSEMTLADISEESMKTVLVFIYTGTIKIIKNAPEVLKLAHNFRIDHLKEVCSSILVEDLTESNAEQYFEIAENVGSMTLMKSAFKVIRRQFEKPKKLQEKLVKNPKNVIKIMELINEVDKLIQDGVAAEEFNDELEMTPGKTGDDQVKGSQDQDSVVGQSDIDKLPDEDEIREPDGGKIRHLEQFLEKIKKCEDLP